MNKNQHHEQGHKSRQMWKFVDEEEASHRNGCWVPSGLKMRTKGMICKTCGERCNFIFLWFLNFLTICKALRPLVFSFDWSNLNLLFTNCRNGFKNYSPGTRINLVPLAAKPWPLPSVDTPQNSEFVWVLQKMEINQIWSSHRHLLCGIWESLNCGHAASRASDILKLYYAAL